MLRLIMVMPVRQRCRKCGNYFMGSDALGKPCSKCWKPKMPSFPKPYIYTWTNGRFVYGEPCDVTLADIAAGLRQPRYNAHTADLYSIAQHSVFVYEILKDWNCDILTQYYGLHHDDHEAFFGDMATPVQVWLKSLNNGLDLIKRAKAILDDVIMPQLGVPWPAQEGIWDVVKAADASAFVCEARQLFHGGEPDWLADYERANNVLPVDSRIDVMHPNEAMELFVKTHLNVQKAYRAAQQSRDEGSPDKGDTQGRQMDSGGDRPEFESASYGAAA